MSAGRILLIVFGSILGLIGLALMAGGGALLWANAALKGDDGYFSTRTERYRSPGRAIVTKGLDLTHIPGGPGRWADLRVRADGVGGGPVFVGIARREDVDRYLSSMAYSELTDIDLDPFDPTYRTHAGTRVPAPPADQSFWAAQVQGAGPQTLTWNVGSGDWQMVAMRPDAAAGVALDASVGVKISHLLPVAAGLLVVGVLILGGGVTMVAVGARGSRAPPSAALTPDGAAAEALPIPLAARAHPVDVAGELDPGLTRWMWLVKWLLAVPHYVVLVFLWIAHLVVTVIAFFAILFTGRYPRGLFEFNVGVLRWTWRVGFYAYSALGTDRYPPFSLEPGDYPAQLDVPYPERLSRGLVLVKWWLLAIPQYIVVAVFAGNWIYGTAWGDRWWGWTWTPVGGGLIGLLALFAAIALLFTGRYPRSLFDLVVALNRWAFRVVAYATLMRDEYPPFTFER